MRNNREIVLLQEDRSFFIPGCMKSVKFFLISVSFIAIIHVNQGSCNVGSNNIHNSLFLAADRPCFFKYSSAKNAKWTIRRASRRVLKNFAPVVDEDFLHKKVEQGKDPSFKVKQESKKIGKFWLIAVSGPPPYFLRKKAHFL